MRFKFRPVYASDSIVEVASLNCQNFFVCSFGSFLLDSGQYESCRKVVTRIIRNQKPKAKFLNCVRFLLPYTSKAKNARMGKGKGGIDKYVHRVSVFGPLFLLRNVTAICAVKILLQIRHKLPKDVCLLSIKQNTPSPEYVVKRTFLHNTNSFLRHL
jgi:ribosomal protein L16/L10AE